MKDIFFEMKPKNDGNRTKGKGEEGEGWTATLMAVPFETVGLLRDVFYLDTRSIALWRVLTSFILLLDLWIRFQTLKEFATDEGVLPTEFVVKHLPSWSFCVHAMSGSYAFQVC